MRHRKQQCIYSCVSPVDCSFKAKTVLYIEREPFVLEQFPFLRLFVQRAMWLAELWLNKLKRLYTRMFWFSCVNTLTNTCKWNSWFQPLWCHCMRLRLWKTQNNVQTWKIERESDYILICTAYILRLFSKIQHLFSRSPPGKIKRGTPRILYNIHWIYACSMHRAWNVHWNRMRSLNIGTNFAKHS